MSDYPSISTNRLASFQGALLAWFRTNGRNFIWRRKGISPYVVLVAEFLLRKTQARTIERFLPAFLEKFPNPEKLSDERIVDLERFLQPLGLQKIRAQALSTMAKRIRDVGSIPADREFLLSLPEVGPYIANAVLCLCFGHRKPLVDANFVRVVSRVFSVPAPKDLTRTERYWEFAQSLLPERLYREFNLAMIDLGALICRARNPLCDACPVSAFCDRVQHMR
ncbi:MAG: hypothetical protein ACTSYX_04595 [Candidatus Thorarchaeota archaeon]